MRNSQPARVGFSLIELMVVVAVMAILSSVATISVLRRMPSYRLQGATRQVVGDLRAARMRAATENARVTVTVDATGRQYSIWTDLNGNNVRDAGEVETHSLAHVDGLSMAVFPASGVFTPRGAFESSFFYMYIYLSIADGGFNYVYVFPSGQVDWPNA